jgi:predicted component of type VI protein secretion system
MAFVTIRIKGSEGYTRVALGKERMVLGRSSDADVPIKHASISREHCVFIRVDDKWFVDDMGSSNGTWVNKGKITGKTPLAEKDIVKAGKSRLTFHLGDVNSPEAAIDVSTHDDDDDDDKDADGDKEEGEGAVRAKDEPHQAKRCASCGAWLSVAHLRSGDRLACPRCAHSVAV